MLYRTHCNSLIYKLRVGLNQLYVLLDHNMLWLSHVNLKTDIALHSHDVHEFVVCLEGEINIHTEHQSYDLRTGQAIFIPENISHSASVNKEQNNHLLFSCINSQV